MAVNELTLAELGLKHAQLRRQAAEARDRWRGMPTGPGAVTAGKRVRALDARANDYQTIITMVLAMQSEQTGVINRG